MPFRRNYLLGEERQVKAIGTRQHTSFRAFIKRHAVLTFYILVLALTFGPTRVGVRW
jgi:hypothetical protein